MVFIGNSVNDILEDKSLKIGKLFLNKYQGKKKNLELIKRKEFKKI